MNNILKSTLTSLSVLALSSFVVVVATAEVIDTKAREAILIDPSTGTVILNKNADEQMPPASMSKLMTAYLLFESINDGRVSLDDKFRVSENAWRKGGAASGSSTMFLPP